MDYQEQLNNGIKRLRLQNCLTQDKFAEKSVLTVETIRNIEHNKCTPTAKTINSICEVFGVTPVSLLLPTPEFDKNQLLNIINIKLQDASIEEISKINDIIDIIKKKYKN